MFLDLLQVELHLNFDQGHVNSRKEEFDILNKIDIIIIILNNNI